MDEAAARLAVPITWRYTGWRVGRMADHSRVGRWRTDDGPDHLAAQPALQRMADNPGSVECVVATGDLTASLKPISIYDQPGLADCEIANLGYSVVQTAGRIRRAGRSSYMELRWPWTWAKQLALGFNTPRGGHLLRHYAPRYSTRHPARY